MTTNHMKPVSGTLILDASGKPRDVSLEKPYHEAEHLMPVTITSAEWQSVHDYVHGLGEDDGSCKPCWFIANERQWFGDYWRGIFSGMDLSTGEKVSLPDTHLSITHVMPIHPPQAPSEE